MSQPSDFSRWGKTLQVSLPEHHDGYVEINLRMKQAVIALAAALPELNRGSFPPGFVGLSIGAHLHPGEDSHGHAEHPPTDWAGLDKLDLADDDSAVELVPCPADHRLLGELVQAVRAHAKPCGVLDSKLEELARRHPDDVAIRKINTVDADLLASQKYLAGCNPPTRQGVRARRCAAVRALLSSDLQASAKGESG